MTSTRGSDAPTAMAPEPDRRIARFSVGARALHWLLAVTFLLMLGTGLALYLPGLATILDRPTAKAWHINAALALAAGVVLMVMARGSGLPATLRQLDRFDRDDRRWLFGWSRFGRREPAPSQGRFNAGQKLNTAIVSGLMVVMFVTGGLLWLGERDTRLRFEGTVIIHDWATWMLIILVLGHLYLALVHRSTRHAMRGMILGDVDREWARRHHRKWVESEERHAAIATDQAGVAAHHDEVLPAVAGDARLDE